MVLPKSKKVTGNLGRAIIRDRFKGQRPREGYVHTTDINDAPNRVNSQSITQEGNLEEFLSTAELAGTEFVGQKLNIKIVTNTYQNPFLQTAAEEKKTLERHAQYRDRLTIPRRPKWDASTTPEQLDRMEREGFLEWRRGLAQLQEDEGLLLTPFERNLEVWRQLWRVIERSQLIVQIVDARNPVLFRSTDLEKYVKEVDSRKENLLLVNKADMLTAKQRRQWADYFDLQGIRYTFFSAVLAKEEQEEEARKRELAKEEGKEEEEDENSDKSEKDKDIGVEHGIEEHGVEEDGAEEDGEEEDEIKEDEAGEDIEEDGEESDEDEGGRRDREEHDNHKVKDDERTRIRTTADLLDIFISEAPDIEDSSSKLTIGLVGYPNVGKSSTINALLGEKLVSVSSTPGKTKHFQTIHLTPDIILCDCPGLVFPTFSTTKADQVCNGVLPIDQLREFTGPVALVTQRIPKDVLELTYGIRIKMRNEEEGGNGVPTAEEFLQSYAVSRGYFKSGQGNPDESRAARYVLKDYVNGKLLYCHPPPTIDSNSFNVEVNDIILHRMRHKKAGPTTHVRKNAATYVTPASTGTDGVPQGPKTSAVDNSFFNAKFAPPKIKGKFATQGSSGFSRVTLYPHQTMVGDDGNPGGRRERLAIVAANMAKTGGTGGVPNKNHKKGRKHVKVRSGAGYDL